ncbi:MAG TPA: BadF/BadG/BcrA/BcrD ATPase family protein, partial [Chloroflexota bacterium]
MTYILGVDAGASKTLAALADETGQVVGFGRAGGANHQSLGLAVAIERVRGAATAALAGAGVDPTEVAVAAYCLAGADLPEDFDLLR